MADIPFKIIADVQDAIKAVSDFAKAANDQLNSITSNTSLSVALEAFHLGFDIAKEGAQIFGEALAKVIEFGKEATDAAIAHEDALQKLNVALKLAGDYTEQTSEHFQQFAVDLSNSTGLTQEAILKAVALSEAYGLTNEQAEKLVSASANLAAVQGTDLDSATNKLLQTYNGITRGLDRTVGGVKQLTLEQLHAGEAVDIIAGKFSGAAEAVSDTFGGALTKAANSEHELLAELGSLITQSPTVITAIKAIGELFAQFGEIIEENKDTLLELVNDGLLFIVRSIPLAIQAFSDFDSIISTVRVSVINLKGIFETFGAFVSGKLDSTKLAEIADETVKAEDSVNAGLEKRQHIYDELTVSANGFADKVAASAEEEINSDAKLISNSEQKLSDQKRGNDLLSEELQKRKQISFLKAETTKAASNPIEALTGPKPVVPVDLKLNKDQLDQLDTQRVEGAVTGIISTSTKGIQGATDLLSKSLGAVADTIVPGIGGAVAQVVSLLAQGPAAVKAQIDSFTAGIPTILENVVSSIPVFVTSLVTGLSDAIDKITADFPNIATDFLNRLAANAPQIAQRLAAEAGPKLGVSLAAQAPFIAARFEVEFAKQAPAIALAIAQGAGQAVADAVQQALKAIPGVGGIFGGGGGGGGGGGIGGVISGIGSALGFATGGTVPPGFPNDSFPARLTSGEVVIEKDDNENIRKLISGGQKSQSNDGMLQAIQSLTQAVLQGSGQNFTINNVLAEKQISTANLNLNRQGFRQKP